MTRFVILRHETPADSPRASHFDLMLESDGALRTWALPRLPRSGETIAVERLADHRIEYLEYEGPVSDNRGSVARYDCGSYQIEHESDERLDVRLRGEKIAGLVRLVCEEATDQRWRLTLKPD